MPAQLCAHAARPADHREEGVTSSSPTPGFYRLGAELAPSQHKDSDRRGRSLRMGGDR